jgi:micrococcal nuclease
VRSIFTIIFLMSTPVLAGDLTGVVTHVRDGDTFEVDGIPIRLNGVSAPELDEYLGPESKFYMRGLVLGKSIRCDLNGKKTYDRFVGTCYLEGVDVGASIIGSGLALDCPRYSSGRYNTLETEGAIKSIKLPKYCKK